MTEEQELNKKLAEWAGFIYTKQFKHFHDWQNRETTWIPPSRDITQHQALPDFSNDLNACFKWLVPNLRHYGLNNWAGVSHTAYAGVEAGNYKVATEETPTLALCKAIEKLIDSNG